MSEDQYNPKSLPNRLVFKIWKKHSTNANPSISEYMPSSLRDAREHIATKREQARNAGDDWELWVDGKLILQSALMRKY